MCSRPYTSLVRRDVDDPCARASEGACWEGEAIFVPTTGAMTVTDDERATTPRVHVLVASDGSPAGARAARQAIALLASPDRITLLRVLTHVPEDDLIEDDDEFGNDVEYTPEQLAWHWSSEIGTAEAELRSAADIIGRSDVDQRVEAGRVASTVCNVARELGVDAIVVGSHARSKRRRRFMRSVSEQIVRDAPCPVLVVPLAAPRASSSSTAS
jgi:nucleotide-binding universal stress UspA family protein